MCFASSPLMPRLAAVFLLLIAACATSAPPREFDPSKFETGAALGPWRVVEKDVLRDPLEETGWIGRVLFEGQADVRGTFQMHFDPEYPKLCFFADDIDRPKLPRFANDVRKAWFCFTNEEDVTRVAKAGDRATIAIADFHYRYSHTDVVNSARFVALR